MLQKAMQEIRGDAIVGNDGEVGTVNDLYFDEERWAVRYLVVDTGNWLPGRKVLISPASVQKAGSDSIRIELTREQVEHAPGIDKDPPISRILEAEHAHYYGYPYYWSGPYLWGMAAMPVAVPPAPDAQQPGTTEDEVRQRTAQQAEASHVRSSAELVGYAIRAVDGEIGHVEDFVVDDESWAIAGMMVDTRNWLPGKKVMVPPDAIAEIDWHNREVAVRLTREELQRAPETP
jgi:sporulation protein YlmC with PRC-barrel domain